MKTSIKLILDKRKVKKDGTYPIVIRLTHNRTSSYLPTGYYVKSDAWESENQHIIVEKKSKDFKEKERTNSAYADQIDHPLPI
jgi:hypothetical protein